jgi:hypothetical protein
VTPVREGAKLAVPPNRRPPAAPPPLPSPEGWGATRCDAAPQPTVPRGRDPVQGTPSTPHTDRAIDPPTPTLPRNTLRVLAVGAPGA